MAATMPALAAFFTLPKIAARLEYTGAASATREARDAVRSSGRNARGVSEPFPPLGRVSASVHGQPNNRRT